jgi:UDP-glucose 4-epimerase
VHVLLVGGSGFIGSHICDLLLSNGIEITVLDRGPEKYRAPSRRVRLVEGDQADSQSVSDALRGVDAVAYLASNTVPQTSEEDPICDLQTNLVPFLRLLSLVRQSGVRRFVLFSSGGTVYGLPSALPVPETYPTNPVASHGIVKLAMEKYLLASAKSHSMEPVILRVGNAYGERQNPFGQFGAVATFLGSFAQHRPIVIWGDGQTVRDYLYAGDVAEACLAAMQPDAKPGIYNVGTGQGHTLNQLLQVIAVVTGQSSPLVERRNGRSYDVAAIVLDSSRARQELGWTARTSLLDGVRTTWEWVRSLSGP